MTKTLPDCADFPAAHSMDATWFAVDKDGHVAVFTSGEGGAIPNKVDESIGQDDDEVQSALATLPEISEPEFKLSALLHPGARPEVLPSRRKALTGWPRKGQVEVLLFRDESPLTPAVRGLPGLRVDHRDRFVLVSLAPDVELAQSDPRAATWNEFKSLADTNPNYVTRITVYGSELALARRSVFFYDAHDERFYHAEPYGQVLAPQRPLRIADTTGALRDMLEARVRLDVSFASSPYVQPIEHVACVTWGKIAVYLASDGFMVRPFPGADGATYNRDAAQVIADERGTQERFKPLVFDPPLDEDTR